MLKGYLIYTEYESKRNDFFVKELLKSAKKYGIDLSILIYEKISINCKNIFYENRKIDIPDFVIQRVMSYHLTITLEGMGIRAFNSSKLGQIADNKYLTYVKMKEFGIPVLKTIFQYDISDENIFYPNVTKPIDSKGGDRVFLNNNRDDYIKNIKTYSDTNFILQGLASDKGKDLRVYVIGNEIVTAVLRTSKDGFISNFCRGNDASLYELNRYEVELVNKIVSIINPDYVGIDFIFNNDGIVLNEIENVVGARMIYSLTDINIADRFIEYIVKEMTNRQFS